MHQLMQKVCMSEELWHGSSRFTRPEQVRLQQHARATRIKVEPTVAEAKEGVSHMMTVLRAARNDMPKPPVFDSPSV